MLLLLVDSLHPNWPTPSEVQGVLGATYTVDIYNTRDDEHIYLNLTNNIGDVSWGIW